VLYPEQTDLKLINSQEEKIELLRKAGLQNLIIVPFSIEFSKTSSHDFISKILVGQLQAKVVVVGHNHHFGHNRQGDYEYLHQLASELGFSVEEIPLQDTENETVSSTKIRKALFEGNIQRANAYLDHQYIISGNLKQNSHKLVSEEIPFYTIEITEEEKLVPPPGVYATNLFFEGKWFKSVTFVIGSNTPNQQVASHLIYDRINLHEKKGTLYFYKKVMNLPLSGNGSIDPDYFEEAKERVKDLIY
jgi:riboflavin kinase/FMN adenylyltransferase